ncbi:MAG TPA: flagellin [Anaerolineaceae bacterium]|nr:flagellin [Anaerolineaceae bacterium]
MASVDVTRVAGNIGALNALNSLTSINQQLAMHQLRLQTGKQINEAADDPSGMSMATTFDIRRLGLKTVLNSIGDAKNLLATAEGGLTKIQDILVKMKNKALEGQGDTIGKTERTAIAAQLNAYADEIDAIAEQTQWNGTSLIGSSGSAGGVTTDMKFLTSVGSTDATGATTGTTSTFAFQNHQGFSAFGATATYAGLGLVGTGAARASNNVRGFSDSDLQDSTKCLDLVTKAIDLVKTGISDEGSFTARLSFKEDAMNVQYTNTEAAYNRIMNANMADEQVQASKLLILQQTSTAMLAQANTAPQFLLSLFR